MIFQNNDRIVFAGDSVTDMGSHTPIGDQWFDDLGHGYVRMIDNLLTARFPEAQLRITNSGVSGDNSRSLLARWERDVLKLNPQWVSICIGINDVWRQFDTPTISEFAVLPEEYRENLRKMILLAKPRVKGIFLMTPYYIEPNSADPMRVRMDEYGMICKELAEEYGCVFIDLQAVFTRFCSVRHSSNLAWDRIHPNEVGATLIALEWLKHCDLGTFSNA